MHVSVPASPSVQAFALPPAMHVDALKKALVSPPAVVPQRSVPATPFADTLMVPSVLATFSLHRSSAVACGACPIAPKMIPTRTAAIRPLPMHPPHRD